MSAEVKINSTELLPIKVAAELVPYSRDYVARLAREGKVVAVQIDRQWFVERASLLNFHEQSLIEDSVRSRHLSQMRKSELEVREVYRAKLEGLAKKQATRSRRTAIQTALVLVCGVGTGALLISAAQFVPNERASFPAQVTKSDWVTPVIQEVYEVEEPSWLAESSVSETTETMPLTGGIVLLPAGEASAQRTSDFFSDEVTVSMTSTTTGVISNGTSEMSFVRVPTDSRATVVPSAGRNGDTP